MSLTSKNTGLNGIKIYVYIMLLLTILNLVWLGYNYLQKTKYSESIKSGQKQLKQIYLWMPKLPSQAEDASTPQPESSEDSKQDIPLAIFKTPAYPEISVVREVDSSSSKQYSDTRYVITINKGIRRDRMIRYVYDILKTKPFLCVTEIELNIEDPTTGDDAWKGKLVFTQRIAN